MRLRLLTLLPVLLAATACSELPKPDPKLVGPFYEPKNVRRNVDRLPENLRRVLLLPLAPAGPQIPEERLVALDAVLQTELNKLARFEVITIDRAQLQAMTGRRAITSVDLIPADFVEKILAEPNRFGADGVLFVDLTSFQPYQPLAVGLRAKLVQNSDRSILWAADLNFSAADAAVANSARRHISKLGTDLGPVDLSHTILQSPNRFVEYCAAATFGTLPAR